MYDKNPQETLTPALEKFLQESGCMLDQYIMGFTYIDQAGKSCFTILSGGTTTIVGETGLVRLLSMRNEYETMSHMAGEQGP